ncbi:uncharacterized protein LOC110810359 [Carica papaya]|uniref:uncharacterized protein LOC110810359 n=1 Tax=Carica papaya TaxID=3649 RepID=UPI000B8CE088|nr:uncharacterized protein LOC110810359 [Carica papaya]
MASFISTLAIFACAFAIFVQATLGEVIVCEKLEGERCAFAVSWKGKRCVLEKSVKRSGEEKFTCRTSEIDAHELTNWVETDQCVGACGLDRKSLGISSDSLLDSRFTQKLCSTHCYNHCPNVVELYFNLAAGEGAFLPDLCEQGSGNSHRKMSEIKSSGIVAPGPINPVKFSVAPAVAPVSQ